MNFNEVSAFISRITYKPGWRIELMRGTTAEFYLRIVHFPTDATGISKDPIPVHSRMLLDHIPNRGALLHEIEIMIKDLELHEVKEWLKLDGKCVDNPHPKDEQP